MGIEDPALWAAIGGALTAVGTLARPVQNVVIFFIAMRGAEPKDRSDIIDSLAKTRQFGPWSKPQWSMARRRKRLRGPPAIEQVGPTTVDDESS